MKIYQRSIIEVPFNLPDGTMPHPLIVLSSNEAIELENSFFGIMLTSQNYDDDFTFEIKKGMTTKPLNVKYCQARLHLISFFNASDIIPNSHWNNTLKMPFFKILVKKINETHWNF